MLGRRRSGSLASGRHADRNIQTTRDRRARAAPRGPKVRRTCPDAHHAAQIAETRHDDDCVIAPDYCEPIVGWRSWRALERDGEAYLASVFHRVRWPYGEPLAGTCETWRLPWRRRHRHAAPAPDCLCGIYAATRDVACDFAPPLPPRMSGAYAVIGTVALWGEVAEYSEGWRASYAYPLELYLISPGSPCTLEVAAFARSLERYEVPVTTIHAWKRRDVVAALRAAA
jgi:hypothetical protein